MLLLIFALNCLHQENNGDKAFKLMFFASSNLKPDDKYYKSQQKIINMRSTALSIARKIRFNEEEIKKHAESTRITRCNSV